MSREATELELAALRSDGQASALYAAILQPATVFSCRVNQTFASNDKITAFNFDGGSGYSGVVLPGMTVYIGTSAGARDRGIVRARKAWAASEAYIGETSEVAWANDLYVTVVDDFRLWRRDIYPLDDDSYLIDFDIAYSAQHNAFAPVVCMGPPAVAWLVEGEAEIAFDASASWCLSSGSKTYQWSASAGVWNNSISATPTLTISAYTPYIRIACAVTVGGVTSSGYRYVFIFDDDHPPYQVKSGELSGDYGDGGWSFDLTFYDDISDLPYNPLVVVFARDWYAGAQGSIGPIAGRENVLAWGWAATENLSDRAQYGQAELSVYGPHWWMDGLTYPVGVELFDTTETPASWKDMKALTVDKALFHLLHWRSTATSVMDVFVSGDTRQAPDLTAQAGTLWEQLKDIAAKKIFAWPCCNRYGQLYIEIDAQMLDASARAALPVVMTLEKPDWRGELEITRRMPRAAHVALSTLEHASGNTITRYSLAPGHIPAARGFARLADGYLAADQDESNALCGLMVAAENVAYDFRVGVAANNRLVDICPRQYVQMDIDAGDTPRGLAYNGNAIVREVSFDWQESGFLSVSWEAEAASDIIAGIDGDIPTETGSDPLPPGGDFDIITVPPLPPDVGGWDGETEIDNAPLYAIIMADQASPKRGLYYTKNFNTASPTWYSMNFGLSQDDVDSMIWFTWNRTGRIYVASQNKIWSCLIGQQLKIVYEAPNDYSVLTIGANPLLADRLMAIVGTDYPGETAKTKIGSSGGLVDGSELSYVPTAPADSGTLTYGTAGWLWTHARAVSSLGTIHRISNDGSEDYVGDIDSRGTEHHYHARAGTADVIIDNVGNKQYTNGGETELELGSPVVLQDRPQAAALSPDGVRVLAVSDDERLRKSSDGGLTWSLVPTEVIGSFQKLAAIDAADANRYAFAASSYGGLPPIRVQYSPDFGVTWIAKTGNLGEIAGTDFIPWALKMIG